MQRPKNLLIALVLVPALVPVLDPWSLVAAVHCHCWSGARSEPLRLSLHHRRTSLSGDSGIVVNCEEVKWVEEVVDRAY